MNAFFPPENNRKSFSFFSFSLLLFFSVLLSFSCLLGFLHSLLSWKTRLRLNPSFFFLFSLLSCGGGGGRKKTMADIDESESKPKILVIGGDKDIVSWLNEEENKKKELSLVFSDLDSDFKYCQGILFYPPETLSEEEQYFEEAIDLFEKDVSRLGGIEGVVLYVWVEERDGELKEEMVKRLRLEERGCVWGFGAGGNEKVIPKMDRFFEENTQTIVLKPAKREK